jgi:hypothetical protein
VGKICLASRCRLGAGVAADVNGRPQKNGQELRPSSLRRLAHPGVAGQMRCGFLWLEPMQDSMSMRQVGK